MCTNKSQKKTGENDDVDNSRAKKCDSIVILPSHFMDLFAVFQRISYFVGFIWYESFQCSCSFFSWAPPLNSHFSHSAVRMLGKIILHSVSFQNHSNSNGYIFSYLWKFFFHVVDERTTDITQLKSERMKMKKKKKNVKNQTNRGPL